MCEYVNGNKCKLTKESCPFMYFCNKTLTWKESNTTSKNCKIKEDSVNKPPKGTYKIVFERKGNLYIDVNNEIKVVKNPYSKDEIPEFVKLQKDKLGKWFVKK